MQGRACIPGTYSQFFQDGAGITRLCSPCAAGTQQPAAGEVTCRDCAAGTFKARESGEGCSPCPRSSYQDQTGAESCKACPEGTTTLFRGMERLSDCVCQAGTIAISAASEEAPLCVACREGLSCPDGGTVELLKSGGSGSNSFLWFL